MAAELQMASADDQTLFAWIEAENRVGRTNTGELWWERSSVDLGLIVLDLAKQGRHAAIGEAIRQFGRDCNGLGGLLRPREIDWASARRGMESALSKPMQWLGESMPLLVGEWLIDELIRIGENPAAVLVFKDYITPFAFERVVNIYVVPGLRWCSIDDVRSLGYAMLMKDKTTSSWRDWVKRIAMTTSIALAVELDARCEKGIGEIAICSSVIQHYRTASQPALIEQDNEDYLADMVRRGLIELSGQMIGNFASKLMLRLVEEGLNHVPLDGTLKWQICANPLHNMLLTTPGSPSQSSGTWRKWVKFKKNILIPRQIKAGLQHMFTAYGQVSIYTVSEPGNIAVRVFSGWHPLVHADWKKIYANQVSAIFGTLRHMRDSANKSDLCAAPGRSLSVGWIYNLMLDYV